LTNVAQSFKVYCHTSFQGQSMRRQCRSNVTSSRVCHAVTIYY